MDILKTLNEIIADYSGKEVGLTESTTFDSLGYDSLDKVEVLMRLEETFGIIFPDDLKVETVGELIREIEKLKK